MSPRTPEEVSIHEKLDDVETGVSGLDSALKVHIAEEEGEFSAIHAKLDSLQKGLDEHVAEHKENSKNFKRGILGLAFTLIGILLSAVWEFLKTRITFSK